MTLIKLVLKIALVALVVLTAAVAILAFSLRATIPEQGLELAPVNLAPGNRPPVLIFGATRNTGLEVARLLTARGQSVTAAVRDGSDRSELEALGVKIVVADSMDPAAIVNAMQTDRFGAVVTTVGCMSCDPPPDFMGNRNIVDAARSTGIKRMILVTSIGAGDSYDAANLLSKIVLRKVLPLKTQAEEHLRASGLGYTIVRPGGLRSNDTVPTGQAFLSEDRSALGFIHRDDLAGLLVAALDDDRTIGKTFAAVDPTVLRPWE